MRILAGGGMAHVVEADSGHPGSSDLRFEMAHQIAWQEGIAGSDGEYQALFLPIGLPAQHILGCQSVSTMGFTLFCPA